MHYCYLDIIGVNSIYNFIFFILFILKIYLFLVVSQLYTINVMDESVLRGNTAILKCHIPSFVADYVFVSGWASDDGDEYSINEIQTNGIEKKIYY